MSQRITRDPRRDPQPGDVLFKWSASRYVIRTITGRLNKPESNGAAERASGLLERMVNQPIRIEQPSSVKGQRWFFVRGYAGGFGAEYGVTLDRRTVEARCKKKAGAGKLVCINGVWHWLANEPLGNADRQEGH